LSLSGELDYRCWVSIAFSDSAHINVSLDLEVALISPGITPGVLDEPVVNTIFSSETDSEDGVVDVRGRVLADIRDVNTSGVIFKSIDDLEGNRNGSDLIDSVEEISLISLGDVDGSTLNVESKG